ncbi:acyltransferase family protein [Saccharomonospora marina XMU15]|uniref:Acyltransferase family protein n=1 Tax=Saccharomonospora marina XMU15 TaxID=882083 RepID=H5X6Y4_9PSEU|nr:acyltransferase domain-containing protein [Saccharomonospora marina]EHR52414.1 acyltransferase family protein [Saccharomonospora marina XMU15]
MSVPLRHRSAVLPLSASSPEELHAFAEHYLGLLDGEPALELDALCRTAANRPHPPFRHAVVGADSTTLSEQLRQFAARRFTPPPSGGKPRVVFVYSGQGAQRPGMGLELLSSEPAFTRRFAECEALVRVETGWSVLDVLEGRIPMDVERHIQPALWALQVSLTELWRDWGIEPHACIGHSMGEVAAAVATGALSVTDGAAVICRRSALLGEVASGGEMWAVQLGEQQARRLIIDDDRVDIAAVNSTGFTTLSGPKEAMQNVIDPLRALGVFCRRLRAGVASHSSCVDPILPRLVDALSDVQPRTAGVPLYSTVLARAALGEELTAAYWAANLREPVRFAQACQAVLAGAERTLFVEIGAHGTLGAALEDIAWPDLDRHRNVPSLRRDHAELESMLISVGAAFSYGCDPRWDRVMADRGQAEAPV